HREQRTCLVLRSLFQQQIALNNITASSAGQKLVVEHADQKELGQTEKIESNALHPEQDLPPHGRCDLDRHIGANGRNHPSIVGLMQGFAHFFTLFVIVKNPPEQDYGDRDLNYRDQNLSHTPKWSFQIPTERPISSAVLRGLISQTQAQFFGNSGTSLPRSTSPVNGG